MAATSGKLKILGKGMARSLKKFGSDADSDWAFGVMVSTLLTFALILYTVLFYFGLSKNLAPEVTLPPDRQLINTKVLDETLMRYENRAKLHKAHQSEKPDLVDPSR